VIAATALAVILFIVCLQLMTKVSSQAKLPTLQSEFREPVNGYSIQPPINWTIVDAHDGHNIRFLGPRERDFPPLIETCLDIAPGHLESYIRELKGRVKVANATVDYVRETSEKLDGCDAMGLEYDSPLVMDSTYKRGKTIKNDVKIHSLQYIIEDAPRFYRVTCTARADIFERYRERFETSARTFKRLPLQTPTPRVFTTGN